jgi:cobalt-zinc-cadmium efflux system outer membrane protein
MKSRFTRLFLMVFLLAGPSCLAELSRAQAEDGQASPVPPSLLTLTQALERVFEHNPELTASELEIEAASARMSQVGRKPNPEMQAETENLAAFGGATGLFHYSENTLQFSHRLELGGKRTLRVRAAEKEVEIASVKLELRKVEITAATSHAFADVLAEQERLVNQQEMSRLARQFHAIVLERVAAGQVSPVEQTRAGVALASAEIEEGKRQQALVASKDRLAALWGGTYREVEGVRGTFAIPARPAAISAACIENSPDLQLASAAIQSRDAGLALERASRIPDLTISGGFRRLNPEGTGVLVAGISIPLPLFDKRQSAIAEARIRLDQSQIEKQAVERRLRADLTQALHDHEMALEEVRLLNESALPAAREAVAAVEEGYRLGKFEFLTLLDAQRTYAELQRRFIEAVASGLNATIEIDRIARCDAGTDRPVPAR